MKFLLATSMLMTAIIAYTAYLNDNEAILSLLVITLPTMLIATHSVRDNQINP